MLISALVLVGQAIVGNATLAGQGDFPVSLAVFPFAIWSALRFGSIAAATVTLLASVIAIRGTMLGTGSFVVDSAMGSLIRWCLFADLMAMTGLGVAAVRSERERAPAALCVPPMKVLNSKFGKELQNSPKPTWNSNGR